MTEPTKPDQTKHGAIGGSGLSDVAIRRPVFTTMVMLGLIVLGLFSFRRLPIDQFPDVDIPVVAVQTVYVGREPGDGRARGHAAARGGVQPGGGRGPDHVHLARRRVAGHRRVRPRPQRRSGRRRTSAPRSTRPAQLPADIDPPVVQKFDPAASPIISLALASNTMGVAELTRWPTRMCGAGSRV
jgi:hydrophobic/amphiphilic exporter-1 (mainly G- bacteria), HAE1 family